MHRWCNIVHSKTRGKQEAPLHATHLAEDLWEVQGEEAEP